MSYVAFDAITAPSPFAPARSERELLCQRAMKVSGVMPAFSLKVGAGGTAFVHEAGMEFAVNAVLQGEWHKTNNKAPMQ